MIFRLSSDTAVVPVRVNLSLEQQVLLLRIITRYHRPPRGEHYPLVNDPQQHRRDGTTASALGRKGLVVWNRPAKTATPTMEGFWLGDALRIEARRREAE